MHGNAKKKRGSGEKTKPREESAKLLYKAAQDKLTMNHQKLVDALFEGAVEGKVSNLQLLIQLAESAELMEKLVTRYESASIAMQWENEEEWPGEAAEYRAETATKAHEPE